MSRLPLRADASESGPLASVYREAAEMVGSTKPPALFTSMAVRPDLAEATWNLAKVLLVDGHLPASVTQLIVLVISAQQRCRYCVAAHRRALEALGITKDTIEKCTADPGSAPLPFLHREILLFARKAARDPNSVTNGDVQSLRDHGLVDGEIAEVAMIVALTKLVNTWAEATAIPVDEEDVTGKLGRII